MGLDMYLTAKCYTGYGDEHDSLKQAIKDTNPIGLGDFELKYLEFQIGYWRKANQIHNWFVENVQKGVDDCGDYVVELKQLHALKDLCEEVLKDESLVAEKLPPRKGFFFGSYEIDEYYFNDLHHTLDILDKIFSNQHHKLWDFYYHSSW